MSASDCLACSGGWPPTDERILDCGSSVAYLNEDQFFPGATILVLKRHAAELFELAPEARSRLMEEVTALARALARAFDAVKINYGLLGNQLPHIHWHLVPRLRGDPAPREAPWAILHDPRRLGPSEREARIARIAAELR